MIPHNNGMDGLACNISALAPEQRAAHQALATQLFTEAAQETVALADGYALRFADERYDDLTAFVANERRCCPFFTFVLEVTPDQGPLWLRITGPDGAKAILQDVLRGA